MADNPVLLANKGTAVVRVSVNNGAIAKGDLLTTSETAGVSQKATINGFVIGSALEDYSPTDGEQVGEILVDIHIHPTIILSDTGTDLIKSLQKGLSVTFLSPLASLRYLIAFAIVVIGFALGFLYFGRIARAGIEALGRNPLARTSIQIGIFINVCLGIVIVAASLGLAVFILVL